ncbi:deoxyribose-phosphate aldolase [Leucobacter viscericola]|uniref:Deoxyribose-phosphate aldolase n=1 Tax=Leucobacter viscericola TaxID=2714935 RepID=A0A6G7XIF2_9MICO|nr:deoxyribose-phosphate aldolase [Leucobacter viscericola]QIK64345.1 deoxyribose-phosphate aldolase [Leucobacter viscericola]
MTQSELTAEHFLTIADHTLLAPGTTAAELDAFMVTAAEIGVSRVCVSSSLLPADARGAEIVTVVGFPSGAHHASVKVAETAEAVANGANEIDMVVNRGLVRAGEWAAVEDEIRAVREACPGRVLKVIIESAALSDEEIVESCRAAEAAGADFVKTSTGFDPAGGASVHAVRLMAATVGDRLGVKASGGIRTTAAVRELWAAGATRFGVSGTAAILAEWDAPAILNAAAAGASNESY